MLSAERRQAIAQLIQEHGAVQVAALSTNFRVSASTIRRDLEELERQGLAHRTYGGAVSIEDRDTGTVQADGEKDRIGQAAAALVRVGETVFLGPGTTTMAVARHLTEHLNLTVITNALDIASLLARHSTITTIVTGGQVQRPELTLIGHISEQNLRELRADKVIIGVGGISILDGLTGESLPVVTAIRAALETASQVIVVADHSKMGRVATVLLAPVDRTDVIITGRDADPSVVWDLTELGIKITQV
ncbi:MAG: DeoR/GlpR family DNA-binding transcription regulator [Chloroflexota bacterium]|nr:DeoR/GlpR family DNA-binding transcription regulator [Chloroflexota bacterium]